MPNRQRGSRSSYISSQHGDDIESVSSIRPSDSHSQIGSPPSVISEATNRPTLNIYATRNGDLAYEPDEKWTRHFNKKGYKINLNQIDSLRDVEDGRFHRFSQYNMYRNGGVMVNNQPVPMLESERETRYTLKGFEHGRVYVPRNPYQPPQGQIRSKMGTNWNGGDKPEPDIKCSGGKLACGIGMATAFIVALLIPSCLC